MKKFILSIDETTHRAAKVAAAQAGTSLNKFFCDAITGHVLRAALKDRSVAAAIETKAKSGSKK